ncbi:MarR family winged helix-turn-helix transcriptional regulator [Nocardiopsis sp. CNT312]|uniref:MarR family winged helix-turn-helix transcriptional regulator n=1 Tax=Nocardiopsis sp. CNT312 TaxID=1137268 RepID=UPI000491A619|nr:MarR family transcriptional regulator [Nocardiopsis sp. CNT312]
MRPRHPAALLSATATTVFRLNAQLLAAAEELARPAGLTAARWQVLGDVADQPRTVSEIARRLGTSRQSVQRIADLLVNRGLAEYRPNPAHRRAKLLTPTGRGRDTLYSIDPAHARLARRLVDALGEEETERAVASLRLLAQALDRIDGT